MTQLLEYIIGARTDIGKKRSNNEDNLAVVPEINLYVLSDGMGGEAAGEMASKMAVDTITGVLRDAAGNNEKVLFGEMQPQFSETTNQLASAIRLSNQAIWQAAQRHAGQRGMGATVVGAWLSGPIMSIAHVGDSRIYILRDGQLQQLTQDHSLVMEQVRRGLMTREEAERSDMQNIIIRALGAEETVQVDLDEVFLMPGDQIVLCSDGLSKMVSDSAIAQIVAESPTSQEAADRLVEKANENGGEDNISVIVVRVNEARPRSLWALFKSLFVG